MVFVGILLQVKFLLGPLVIPLAWYILKQLLAVLIQQASAKQTIDCAQFMSWLSVEPQSIVWLPTLHRLAASEAGMSRELICCLALSAKWVT